MAGAGKDNIHAIKQEVPKFIRDFQERNKLSLPPIDSDKNKDDSELEKLDEAPTVCVGKDVSIEEAYEYTKEVFGKEACDKNSLNTKRKHEQDLKNEESGKVIFKKPTNEKKGKEKKSKMPKVKNPTLLSFDDEDEE